MKGFKKGASACFFILWVAGLGAGWMVVQQGGVTPSEAQMGPGSQPPGPQMQGPPPKLPPKLLAAPAPPPEEDMGPPPDPTPRKRPTKQELLEKIRQMPGGPEKIEEAKRRGARIGMGPVESESALSWLNPLRVKEAEAQSSYSLTLDPSNSWYSSSPYGSVAFHGSVNGGGWSTAAGRLYIPSSSWTTNLGIQVTKPLAYLKANVSSDGWYIVNFEASVTSGTSVNMKHFEGGTYPTVESWTGSGISSYPALLELSAGWHYFYWINSSSTAYIYEVDVYSVP